jgi:hypothetical protein
MQFADDQSEDELWRAIDNLQKTFSDFDMLISTVPITIVERIKACTVFARSEAVIVGSNPTQGMDVWCVYVFFCVCVVLCLGSGPTTDQSLAQGVLPSVKWIKRMKKKTDEKEICWKN